MSCGRPAADEYDAWFSGYVARVPGDDPLLALRSGGARTAALLAGIDEARGASRYAPGKWSVKQVLQHVVDGERLFAYRALCIARGDAQDLPGFDENAYAAQDGSDGRTVASIAAEFAAVRAATLPLFESFAPSIWDRRGRANGRSVTVRGLAWIAAGHELHHLEVLRQRYGVG